MYTFMRGTHAKMSKPLYSVAQDYAKVYEQIERNRPFPMIEGLVRAGGWFDVAMLAVSAGVVGIATGFSAKRAQKEAPRVRHMTAALSLSTMDVVAEIGTGSVAEASGASSAAASGATSDAGRGIRSPEKCIVDTGNSKRRRLAPSGKARCACPPRGACPRRTRPRVGPPAWLNAPKGGAVC